MKKHLLTVPMMLVMTLLSGCYSTQPRCASGFCSENIDVVEVETAKTESVYVESSPALVREDIATSQVQKAPCTAPVDLKNGTTACAAPVKVAPAEVAPASAPAPVAQTKAPVVAPLVPPKAQDAKDVPEDVLVEPMVVKQAPTPSCKKDECYCSQASVTYTPTVTYTPYVPCPCNGQQPQAGEAPVPSCGCAQAPAPAPVVEAQPSEQDKIEKEMQELQAQKEALTAERAQLEAQLKSLKTTEKTSVEVKDWVAVEGVTLRTLLTEWGDAAGWRVIWNMDRDYTLEASATFRGRFVDVASALVRSFARAVPAPKAVFYQGNKVLVVSTREDENAE